MYDHASSEGRIIAIKSKTPNRPGWRVARRCSIGETRMNNVYADAETPGSALFPTKRSTELLALNRFAYLGSMNMDLSERNQPAGRSGGRHDARSFYQKVSLHVFDP